MLSITQRLFKRKGDLSFLTWNEFRSECELRVGVEIRWEKRVIGARTRLDEVRGKIVDLVDSERSLLKHNQLK